HLGAAAGRKGAQRILERAGANVVEAGRNHTAAPRCLAPCIAAHTRAGVSGLSIWRIPKGSSASHTALTTQAADAIVPASPTPFTPSGLTGEGVTVWAVSIRGIWLA